MLPVALNVSRLRIALIGTGKGVIRRLQKLDEAECCSLVVFSQDASKELKVLAGARLVERLPEEEEYKNFQLVLVVDIEDKTAFEIGDKARNAGALINVEDRREYCDFYYSAVVRRGDLLIGVNTNGQCPTLTVRIRQLLEKVFPSVWAERLQELGRLRHKWRAEGASMKETMVRTDSILEEKGWLEEISCSRGLKKESKRQ